MDSASDYGSEGWGFESLQGHGLKSQLIDYQWLAFLFLLIRTIIAPQRKKMPHLFFLISPLYQV